MTRISIFHNPRCSKSRQALELLKQSGADVEVLEYLKTPPETQLIGAICRKLGVRPTEIVRTKESAFKDLGLSLDDDRSDSEWCGILSQNPILIERPIVVSGDQAVIGRPPENVLGLL